MEHLTFISRLITISILIGIVSGCGGAPADNPNYVEKYGAPAASRPESSSSSSSSSSGTGAQQVLAAPSNGYLDCDNLDTDKVYLFGTIGTDTNTTAIGDPLDPTSFCVGSVNRFGTINAAGRYLHDARFVDAVTGELEQGIHIFGSDSLWRQDGEWVYKTTDDSYVENDELIVVLAESAIVATAILAHPSNPNQLAYLYFRDLYSADGELLYSVSNGLSSALAMLDDGSIIVGEYRSLSIVSTEGIVTPIPLPEDMSVNWRVVGKHHEGGIWLLSDDVRWNLTPTFEMVRDGLFAARPDSVANLNSQSNVIDGEGNLWELMFDTGNSGVIIKRPLASEGVSEIVYDSASGPTGDWWTNPNPFVFPFQDSSLVTGP